MSVTPNIIVVSLIYPIDFLICIDNMFNQSSEEKRGALFQNTQAQLLPSCGPNLIKLLGAYLGVWLH